MKSKSIIYLVCSEVVFGLYIIITSIRYTRYCNISYQSGKSIDPVFLIWIIVCAFSFFVLMFSKLRFIYSVSLAAQGIIVITNTAKHIPVALWNLRFGHKIEDVFFYTSLVLVGVSFLYAVFLSLNLYIRSKNELLEKTFSFGAVPGISYLLAVMVFFISVLYFTERGAFASSSLGNRYFLFLSYSINTINTYIRVHESAADVELLYTLYLTFTGLFFAEERKMSQHFMKQK